MDNLKTQHAKRYSKISYDVVMFLFDYHPWNDNHNPRIDKTTHNILNTKKANGVRLDFRGPLIESDLEVFPQIFYKFQIIIE
jgi:hypothetical protein